MTLQDWMNATAAQLDESGVFLGHGTDNSWDEALHLTLPLLDIPFDADPSVLQRVLNNVLPGAYPPPISLGRPGFVACHSMWMSVC